jgi:hypothetical protein
MNLRRTAGPDPWSIGDIGILDNNQLANGPGISPQTRWRRNQRDWSVARLLYAERATSRQAYKLDRLNVMGYYKNRGHLTSHRLLQAVLVRAGPKKG